MVLQLLKGIHYLINHPDESWELFIKNRPELDDKLNRRAWFDTIPRFALRPASLDTNRYIRFEKFMHEAGLISSIYDHKKLAVEIIE